MEAIDGSGDLKKLSVELDARFRGPLMRFFLRRVNSRTDAEDLTQEVLLRVINAARDGHIDNAPAFVFRIAINLLKDRRRKLVRSGMPVFVPIDDALAGEIEQELMEQSIPERTLAERDTLADAFRTLGELGGLTRDIFILFRIEKMKQKEIASLYGIGQSTVEKHVMKAVAYLATRYGSHRP